MPPPRVLLLLLLPLAVGTRLFVSGALAAVPVEAEPALQFHLTGAVVLSAVGGALFGLTVYLLIRRDQGLDKRADQQDARIAAVDERIHRIELRVTELAASSPFTPSRR